MLLRCTLSIASALIVMSISSNLYAQEEGEAVTNGWVNTRLIYAASKKDFEAGIYEESDVAYLLHPERTDIPGVLLGCFGNKFFVRVSIEPNNFRDLLTLRTKRIRTNSVKLLRNGEVDDQRDWTYFPAYKTYAVDRKKAFIQIYNMVVRKDEFAFKPSNKDAITIELPPVDEAFKDFSRNCGLIKSSSAAD